MSPSNPCPDPAELQKLIAGDLGPGEQALLTRHLDACASCQAALERMTGGRESWHDIARQLGAQPHPLDQALANAMEQLRLEPGRQETAAEHRDGDQGSLDFLDPPAAAGHIGRLAEYEILGVVGRGGMGVVLKAFDPELHRVVAIKVMAPVLASNATARKRFKREAQAAAAVTNDHVVTIHAVREAKDLPYLVMQYIDGRSLQERIDLGGALELKEILRISMQAATGLAAAHAQGLVHRDIKPANILLENGVERVKITDFGLARAVDDARVTQSGVVTGTPQYMAPEQARGESVDHRADLFSLGGVLYAMCTGYAPFRASSSMAVLKKVCDEKPRPIRDLNSDIPDWLTAIVERLMAKNAAERFESAKEVADLLGQHLAHLQQPSRVPAPPRVEPIRVATTPTVQTQRRSLVLPILLMIAPFVLVPLLVVVDRFLSHGGSTPVFVFPILMGVACFFLGVILLVVQLARPPREIRLSVAQPQPRRSRAWVVILVVALVCAGLLFCLVPAGLLLSFWLIASAEPKEQSHFEGGRSAEADNVLGPAERKDGIQNNDYVLDGLRWFPEECTFCATYSFQSSIPELSDSLIGLAKSLPVIEGETNPVAEAMNAVGDGSITGIAYAYAEEPAPKRSRHFLRVYGLWNRARAIEALTSQPGASVEELPKPVAGQRVTLILRAEYAIAVVGSEDILIAGYDGKATATEHGDVMRAALAAKEADVLSKKGSLLSGPLGAELLKVPHKGFCVLGGELPKELRQPLKQAGLTVLPRAVSIGLAEGKDESVILSFHASLANSAESQQLVRDMFPWPELVHSFLERSLASQPRPGTDEPLKDLRATVPEPFELKTIGSSLEGRLRIPKGIWRAGLALAKGTALGDAPTMPARREQVLKRFGPEDKPITSEVRDRKVTPDDGGWKIECADNTKYANDHSTPRVRLFEVATSQVEDSRFRFRFKARSETAERAFFEFRRQWPQSVADITQSKVIEGSTNWTSYEITWDAGKNARPNVTLALDLVIRNKLDGSKATVWVKDVELVKVLP